MPDVTQARAEAGGRTRDPGPDRAGLRLGLLAAGLVAAVVAGFALGRLTGGAGTTVGAGTVANHTHAPGVAPHDHAGTTGGTTTGAGGLTVSAGGYTMVPVGTTFTAGRRADFRFSVNGPDRMPMRRFAVVQDKPMHLVVVRRDLSGFQHLHPTMAADGTWSVALTLPAPGVWRALADLTVIDGGGNQMSETLGVDLVAPGAYAATPLPPAARQATVDGFTVGYEGTPRLGSAQPLTVRVSRDAAPAALEPYLGAYGHLVVLREVDLAYLHVHPDRAAAGTVRFWLAAPSPGRYRMFFDFRVGGAERTAAYTVDVT